MIIGRLSIRYDRGVTLNKPEDVGAVVAVGQHTDDGGIVRGHGTKWRDEQAQAHAEACGVEERRIRAAFKRQFLGGALPGTFILPSKTAGGDLLASLDVAPAVDARCAVYDLRPHGQLPPAELAEWTGRIRAQFEAAPLGRAKAASAEGLSILEKLADCPILAQTTRDALASLIGAARLETIDRQEFRRQLSALPVDVHVGPTVAPRRVRPASPRAIAPAAEPEAASA